MVDALADLLTAADGEVAVVGHGGVGTLWWCHLSGVPIARAADQARPGNLYDVNLLTGRPTGPWRPFEDA